MALLKKKKIETPQPIESREDLVKPYVYVTIVDEGVGQSIIKLCQSLKVSAQFLQKGQGTANKQIRDILGIEDNKKEIIFSLVREDLIPDLKKELEAFFLSSKKNKGIGFSIKMDSLIGVRLYHFLTHTV